MLSQTQVQLCFVIVSIQAAWGNLINPCQDDNSPMTNNYFFFAFLHPDKRTNYKKSKVYERYTECKNSVLATGQEIDLPK